MKIIKFRIKNFKSIIDSGDCYLSDSITILAGKNEAGKSSILEALFDFNTGIPIREKSLPLNIEKSLPEVSVVFDLSKEEYQGIFKDVDIDLDVKKFLVESIPENYLVEIKKLYPSEFTIFGKIFESVNTTIQVLAKKLADDIKAYAGSNGLSGNKPLIILLAILQSENVIESNEIQKNISFFQSEVGSPTSSITEAQKHSLIKLSSDIQSSLDELKNLYWSLQATVKSEILKRIPNFILFNSFEDVFPNEVSFSELESNPWIIDLCKMSNLDISIVTGSNNPIKKQHKHLLNIKLNNDFSQYWTQDLSQLSIDWDGSILSFWIEEDGIFYPPELRSQGRRWHLAFYVKVSAKSKAGANNVILIDEPGLYLHATAQRDILKHLEDSSEHNQILMSTHSPYLIEPDKLERIRLVQKSNTKGTRIENKIHAVSDKETLTPILTAIGLELNQGIANSDKNDNVIVEGPSDYFYLTALKEKLNIKDIHFIFGGGSGNMTKIGTILQGWGSRVQYLFDDDQAFQAAKTNINREWKNVSKDWLGNLGIKGSIEDLFTKEEFARILEIDSKKLTEANSAYMKAAKLDKVLPARKFLDQVRKGVDPHLSPETMNQAKRIFSELQIKFKNYSY